MVSIPQFEKACSVGWDTSLVPFFIRSVLSSEGGGHNIIPKHWEQPTRPLSLVTLNTEMHKSVHHNDTSPVPHMMVTLPWSHSWISDWHIMFMEPCFEKWNAVFGTEGGVAVVVVLSHFTVVQNNCFICAWRNNAAVFLVLLVGIPSVPSELSCRQEAGASPSFLHFSAELWSPVWTRVCSGDDAVCYYIISNCMYLIMIILNYTVTFVTTYVSMEQWYVVLD